MLGTRKNITVGKNQLSYIELANDSSQPVILFLHGWGGSAESFQTLMTELNNQLSTHRHLIALDLPGFGESAPPLQAWSVADYSSCVVKYIEALSIGQVDLVVHSFGGRIATKLLNDRPDLVRKIAYLAPAGIRGNLEYIASRESRASRIKKLFQFPLLRPLFPIVRKIGYKAIGGNDYIILDGVMKETFSLVTQEDLTALLPNVQHPTEIFWGRHDSYVPVSDGEYMTKVMKQANLTIFEDGRHGIHRTHATQIANRLKSFL